MSRQIRGELDWIVMKALEKDRTRRYETATGFALDVQRYLAGEAVLAVPPSAGYRLRKFVRRHRGPVLAAALVVLALVVGVVGATWGMVRAVHAEAEAVSEARQKETALTAAQRSEREARESLRVSLHEQARALRFSHRMGQRTGSLDAVARAAAIRPDERLRDEATVAMALPDIRLGPKWHAWPPGTYGWAFDAQYRNYARIGNRGDITILSLPDNRELRRIDPDPHGFAGPCFSPDGKYLSALEWGSLNLRIWRLADGKAVHRDELRHVSGWSYNFSPDSRHLVTCQQGSVIRFDLATGQEVNRWQLPEKMPACCLVFHPDNRLLAVGYHSSNVVSVYDATSGKPVATLPLGTTVSAQTVAWHPDGERLAVSGQDPRIQIWNVTARRKLATLDGHTQPVCALSFHPEGGLLLSSSFDGTVRLWDPATGRQLMKLSARATWTRFSSDGRWLGVSSSGEHAQLLEVISPREHRSLGTGPTSANWEHDLSPDGQLLALNLVYDVRLYHLPSGRELAALPAGRPLFNSDTELLIAGSGELHRWPIRRGADNELRLGPPRTIALPVVPTRAERSQDGRTLAIVGESAGVGVVVDLATDSVRALRLPHARAGFVALSRDGRWFATSGWHSNRVRLWNAETGKQVHEWVIHQAMVFFSPDSRALIISQSEEFSFWDVESLRPIRQIRRDAPQHPGHVCFSPDGKLMALAMAPGVVHLKDAATERTVAKLEDPYGDRAGWMSFTPDGTQLVVNTPFEKAVHIWDLRAIRQRLKGMRLDWDWPEFTPAAAADEPGQRLPGPAWNVQIIQPGTAGRASGTKPK